ncbi:PREDICTED: olfactory receptor 50-like [Nanorana parkeri]|uniref:olfactory receptor 50-like n=1 Tax=Nanorana parkeri TaxID=125878 RepID=UPI000854200F|nr:PREDICTED: olfactory receptor 50-like [Nanorana parkeri]
MKNVTMISSLTLVGLSDHPPTMRGLFLLFLWIYLMTVIINLFIFFLVLIDHHLHNPMYFFLSNLSVLDMSYSSVTAPRMLFDLVAKSRSITIPACRAQVFFFLYFACSELLLLSAMSYDRYVAICQPLHYMQIMSWSLCSHLACFIWVFSFIYALVHTLCLLRLSFCGPISIHNFFCDLPHLFQISCSDPTINIVLVFALGGIVTLGAFLCTFLPYVRIFNTILRIRSKTGKLKAFSTCTSHLTVVFIFYGSLIFIYFVPTSSNMFSMNKLFSVIYALINPLLNPLIYSLRSRDLKAALKRSFRDIRTSATSFIYLWEKW